MKFAKLTAQGEHNLRAAGLEHLIEVLNSTPVDSVFGEHGMYGVEPSATDGGRYVGRFHDKTGEYDLYIQ